MAVPVSFVAREHDPVITPPRCNNKLSIIILYHGTTTLAVYTYISAHLAAQKITSSRWVACGDEFEGPGVVRQNNFLCAATPSAIASVHAEFNYSYDLEEYNIDVERNE